MAKLLFPRSPPILVFSRNSRKQRELPIWIPLLPHWALGDTSGKEEPGRLSIAQSHRSQAQLKPLSATHTQVPHTLFIPFPSFASATWNCQLELQLVACACVFQAWPTLQPCGLYLAGLPLSLKVLQARIPGGLPFLLQGSLPGSGIKPSGLLHLLPLAGGLFAAEQLGSPQSVALVLPNENPVGDKSVISILALQNPENSCKTTPPLPPYFD